MDLVSCIMTCVIIAVTIACVLALRTLFGWSFWVAFSLGLPLSWALIMAAVWLLDRRKGP